MTTPSGSVRVKSKTKKKVKFNPHPLAGSKPEHEKKTIFQYIGLGLGMSPKRRTTQTHQGSALETIKKIIISIAVYAAIGYIVGMIIDMFIDAPYPMATILCLLMVLFWIFRNLKKYLGPQIK